MLKKLFILLLTTLLIAVSGSGIYLHTVHKKDAVLKAQSVDRLGSRVDSLLAFNKAKKYNEEIAFLVDFSLPSFQSRFYMVDLKSRKILKQGLVTHGQADSYAKNFNTVKFSNTSGSYCSSKGFYSIGVKYQGQWGTAYRLHGLQSSNSNALKRAVVLHAHECVPEADTNLYICLSQGCPTLNPTFFASLQPDIDKAQKPILLYIYK